MKKVPALRAVLHGMPVLAVLALLCAAPPLRADERACIREVRFPKGATETTLAGQIKGYAFCDYVVSAAKGRQLQVWLTGEHVNRASVILRSPVEAELSPEGETFVLPADGTYTIRVLMIRTFARRGHTLRYSLRIRIR